MGQYGLYFLLAAALMNLLLVSRHTRVEEQSGRAELVRASVVGRPAPLTVQVTEHSRAASGLAGVTLGAAFVVPAAGDLLGDHGSPLS